MISCENASVSDCRSLVRKKLTVNQCPIGWFHLDCLGLKLNNVPKGSWFCDTCTSRLLFAGVIAPDGAGGFVRVRRSKRTPVRGSRLGKKVCKVFSHSKSKNLNIGSDGPLADWMTAYKWSSSHDPREFQKAMVMHNTYIMTGRVK